MTDSTGREPRDPRTASDPRDQRDPRESDDPRDVRDPRQPGDPRLGDERSGIPRFIKALVVGVAVGSTAVGLGAWRLAVLRADEKQHDCEQAVTVRLDNRAMWIWLSEQFPEDALEVGLIEQLDERLPLLNCSGDTPLPRRKHDQ